MIERFIYLAAPYSHPNPHIRHSRFETINEVVAHLMRQGWVVYSPISHNHPIALNHDLPTGWEFWGKMDRVFIKHSAMVVILTLPGWNQSVGVKAEMKIAKEFNVPIVFLNYITLTWHTILPRVKDGTVAGISTVGE